MGLPRRDFLRLTAGAGLALGAPGIAGQQQPVAPAAKPPVAGPRNVIFMVADGMSTGTLELADLFSRLTRQRPLRWASLWNQPHVRRASCSTHAADGYVTDSSAASSAWSIGERVNNGTVNFTPDGRQPEPILAAARRAGLATGVVTTTRVTHATPAGFYANCPDRDLEQEIAGQLLERRVDVALGGGAKYFAPKLLSGRPDLKVVRAREALLALDGSMPLLGLFAEEHMHYELDRPETEPTLAEMTSAALRMLGNAGRGFIVQIEGGRVDQAAHANDAAAMLREMLTFDDAVGVALEFAAKRDDTLVVITTDHGCANPGLTFYGKEGVASFARLAGAKRSFQWVQERAAAIKGEGERAAQMPALAREASGIDLSERESAILLSFLRGQRVDPFGPANALGPVLGSVLANHFGVAFLSPNHTSDFVEVTALGPGADSLQPMIENTALHGLLTMALAR